MTPNWFNEQIETLFRPQTARSDLARFLIAAGDTRSFATIMRTIANWSTGATPCRDEMRVLLTVLQRPGDVAKFMREARQAEQPLPIVWDREVG